MNDNDIFSIYFTPQYLPIDYANHVFLLPAAEGSTSGGGRTEDITISLNGGELALGGNYDRGNIYYNLSTASNSSSISVVKFSNAGSLNLAAQTGDVQYSHPKTSQYTDESLRVFTAYSHDITHDGDAPPRDTSGTYTLETFTSTGGTFSIVSDLVGDFITSHNTSLTGVQNSTATTYTPLNNTLDNIISTATFHADSINIYNNFIGNIETNHSVNMLGWQAAAIENNLIAVDAILASTGDNATTGDFIASGRFGIQDETSQKGIINATNASISLISDAYSIAGGQIIYKKWITRNEYEKIDDEKEKRNWEVYELDNTKYVPVDNTIDSEKGVISQDAWKSLPAGDKSKYVQVEIAPGNVLVNNNNNRILTNGIRAANSIQMKKGFEAEVNTTLRNVVVESIAGETNNQASLDFTAKTYGLTAQTFNVTGAFTGNITTTIENMSFTVVQPDTKTYSTQVDLSTAGLYFTDSITVSNYLSGNITVNGTSIAATSTIDKWISYFYGIYAENSITVGSGAGVFDTEINITVDAPTGTDSKAFSNIIGIKTKNLDAGSLAADINITVHTGVGIGVQIDTFKNNVDSVFNVQPSSFDIIGNISVSYPDSDSAREKTMTFGIMIADRGAVNLRISSKVSADIAILSGSCTYNPSHNTNRGYLITTLVGGNDHIEIAAGSVIKGDIELGSGEDSIYIDSNARIEGDFGEISDEGGRKNMTFMLNQYGSVNGDLNTDQDIVYDGKIIEEATTYVIDLNDAADGQTYSLFRSAMVAAGTKSITVINKGEAKLLNLTSSSTLKFNDGTIISGVADQNNMIQVTVTRPDEAYLDRLAQAVNLIIDGNLVSYSFSNAQDRAKQIYDDTYKVHITYNLYDKNGNLVVDDQGKAVVYDIYNECTNGSFTAAVDDYTIGNIRAEIIHQPAGSTASRVNTLAAASRIDSATETFIIEWSAILNEVLTDAYRYELEYSIKKEGDRGWSNSTVVTLDYLASSYSISDIREGDKVRARLRLKNVGSTASYKTSEWTDVHEPPNNPTKEEAVAATGFMNLRVGQLATAVTMLQWDDMRDSFESGLKYYEVQYFATSQTDSQLTDAELQAIWKKPEESGYTVVTRRVTSNKYYLSNVDFNNNYYWRVKAVSNAGTEAMWSENYHFSTIGHDTTPPEITPGTNITVTSDFYYVSTEDHAAKTVTIKFSSDKDLAYDTGSGIAYYVLYYKGESDTTYKSVRFEPGKSTYETNLSFSHLNQQISYYITARDKAGNETEALKSGVFQGDTTAPVDAFLESAMPENQDEWFVENDIGGLDFVVSLRVNCGYDPENSSEIDSPSGISKYMVQYQKTFSSGVTQWITVDVRYAYQLEGVRSYTVTAPGIDTNDIPFVNNNHPTYWRLLVEDNAGNVFTSNTLIIAEEGPIEGTFTLDEPSISVTYNYFSEDPNVENGALLREPSNIAVNFTVGFTEDDNPNSTFTDPNSIIYRIEFASSKEFSDETLLFTDRFTGSSYTLSTANNGIAYIAIMAQGSNGYYSTYNQVPDTYWRVCAYDAYGNRTAYSDVQQFKLADKELDRSFNDYHAPEAPELYAPEEVEGSDGAQWNLRWSPVSDPFGIYTYEIALSNGKDVQYTYTTSHIDETTTVIGGNKLPVNAGTYTVTVTAIDGSGKRSKVSNSQIVHCSVKNPVYPGTGTSAMDPKPLENTSLDPDSSYFATVTSTIGTDAENTEHNFRYDGITENGYLDLIVTGLTANIKVSLYANRSSGKWKKLKTIKVNSGTTTILSDYLIAANFYYVKVEATDKKNFSAQTSYTLNFNSTYLPDPTPNKSFDTAEEIQLQRNAAGTQDTGLASGFVGYKEAKDYYVFSSDIAGSLNFSVITNADIKITVYNSEHKKIATGKAKGSIGNYSALLKKNALCPSGNIYLLVEAADKGKGKHNANYAIGLTDYLFQPATHDDTMSDATRIYLDANGQGAVNGGWVGYGDKIDMYKFVSANIGAVKLGITAVEAKLKVTLYDAAGKKLKSKNITGSASSKFATTDIFGKDVLLNSGETYYVAVESGDKGKGYQNSFYNLSVNEKYAPPSQGNNTINHAMFLAENTTVTDWVGYGERYDYYKITLDNPNSYIDLNFNLNGKAGIKMTSVYGNVSLKQTDSGYTSSKPLAAGEYFIEVYAKSPNNANSWSNTYSLSYNVF